MASKFGTYPDIDNTASSQAETVAAARPTKNKEIDISELHKTLESTRETLRKNNQLLKKGLRSIRYMRRKTKQCVMQQKAVEQQEDSIKESNCKNMKGFFTKLGDAICKAVPSVLTAIATAAIGWLFNMKSKTRGYQTCYAR